MQGKGFAFIGLLCLVLGYVDANVMPLGDALALLRPNAVDTPVEPDELADATGHGLEKPLAAAVGADNDASALALATLFRWQARLLEADGTRPAPIITNKKQIAIMVSNVGKNAGDYAIADGKGLNKVLGDFFANENNWPQKAGALSKEDRANAVKVLKGFAIDFKKAAAL